MKKNIYKLAAVAFITALMILPITHEFGGKDFYVLNNSHALSINESPVGTNAVVKIAKDLTL